MKPILYDPAPSILVIILKNIKKIWRVNKKHIKK